MKHFRLLTKNILIQFHYLSFLNRVNDHVQHFRRRNNRVSNERQTLAVT